MCIKKLDGNPVSNVTQQLSGLGCARLVQNTAPRRKMPATIVNWATSGLSKVQLSDGNWLNELVSTVVPL